MTLSLSTPVKLYRVEPWVFARVGSLLHRFVPPCVGEGLKRGQCCCWLTFGGLPGTHPVSSHLTHFPYVTGTPPAAVLVVVPRVGGFAYFQPLLRNWKFLPLPKPPLVFTARSYEAFFFLVLKPWAAQIGQGLSSLTHKVSTLIFIHCWGPLCVLSETVALHKPGLGSGL